VTEYDPTPEPFDGEYGVVRLQEAWHVLSLACFAGAMGARLLVGLLPSAWWPPFRPLLPGLVVLALASLGLLFGLIGLRVPRIRGAARIAVFLNGVVLVLGLLAAAALLYILPN
jgi:hypothetical protein